MAVRIFSGIFGILVTVGGIFCLTQPAGTFLSIAWIMGVVMVADGIVNLVLWSDQRKNGNANGWAMSLAVLSLILGVLLLVSWGCQFIFSLFIVLFLALWFVLQGIIRIIVACKAKGIADEVDAAMGGNLLGLSRGWLLFYGILSLIVGIISFLSPITLAVFIGIIIGIAIIFIGLNLITFAVATSND